MATTTATFTIEMTPADALPGSPGRFVLTKRWSGGIEGDGVGTMLTAGDPSTGSAGYVVIETIDGAIDGRRGTIALQQLGRMHGVDIRLTYEIVPGSGTGDLEGVVGTIDLEVDDAGVHTVTLDYEG